MKNNKFKIVLLAAFASIMLSGCVKDDDTALPEYQPVLFGEDFNGTDNTLLEIPGWTNFAEQGSVQWKIQVYSGNGYAEFNPYSSGENTNVGWLVTPPVNVDDAQEKKLVFQASQSYVSDPANKLEVFVATDYDGTNVEAANWTPVQANLPGTSAVYFEFMNSGEIDLSGYSGNINVAFKVTGSGNNTALDGSYQIDNVRIY